MFIGSPITQYLDLLSPMTPAATSPVIRGFLFAGLGSVGTILTYVDAHLDRNLISKLVFYFFGLNNTEEVESK